MLLEPLIEFLHQATLKTIQNESAIRFGTSKPQEAVVVADFAPAEAINPHGTLVHLAAENFSVVGQSDRVSADC